MSPAIEYEAFQYKHFDEPALSLEQAAETASRLRKSDPNMTYRVVPADSEMSGFRIEEVPIQTAYAEVWARVCKPFFRLLSASAVRGR